MVHGRTLIALLASLAISAGCGGAVLKSNEIKFTLYESPILVKETGAIIVAKRQVARVLEDGKVVDGKGRPVAFVRDDGIRLKGGITIPFRVDQDGTLTLSRKAQEQADLKPVVHRLRTDGSMATTKNARGVMVDGAHTERNRRIILFVLLMSTNNRW